MANGSASGGFQYGGIEFEWDLIKAASNLRKHGLSFQEAATMFSDQLALTVADPDHSAEEDRFVSIGYTETGRLVVVTHTDRDGKTRIICARTANRKERKTHEEGEDR
jgi:uncharacterized DUF497 family protein